MPPHLNVNYQLAELQELQGNSIRSKKIVCYWVKVLAIKALGSHLDCER